MIRVVITGPPSGTGYFPYKIDWWVRGKPQFVGYSNAPLLDACRQLQQYGLMDDTVVGLFEGKSLDWLQRTTVGYGARSRIDYLRKKGAVQPPPETSFLEVPDVITVAQEEYEQIKKDFDFTDEEAQRWREGDLTYERPATPEEPPRRPRKRPRPRDGTGPAVEEPTMLAKRHRRRKRAGSGARRGSR